MTALLSLQNLSKFFCPITPVIENLSFTLKVGERCALVGDNGAGKTTLLKLITGLETPTAGQVMFAGQDITPLPFFKRTQRGIVYIGQHATPFQQLSVLQNMRLVTHEPEKLLSLSHLNAHAFSLDLASQKVLMILQAIALKPRLLILDEFFAGVDETQLLIDLLEKFQQNISFLVVEHHKKIREVLCQNMLELPKKH